MDQTISTTPTYARTAVTYTVYSMMAFFGMSVVLPGAFMPFIGERLGLTYGQTGMHFTANAAGALLIGLYGERLAERFGNRLVSWVAAMIVIGALFFLTIADSLIMTLPTLFVYGAGVISVGQFATAAAADEHPHHNDKILPEINIMAGLGVAISPVILGQLETVGIGWQAIVGVMAAVLILMVAVFGRVSFPRQQHESTSTHASDGQPASALPKLFWVICTIVFLSVAIEWLLFFWSPDFLAKVVGFDQGTASALISVQAFAIVIGRLIGRHLLNLMTPGRLLTYAFAWVLIWLPVYLFSPFPMFNVIGLFGLGLGIANLFPLTISGAMVAGGEQTGRASARVTVFASTALLIVPNLVGLIAEDIGIRLALLSIGILALVAIGVVSFANHTRHASATPHAL